MVRFVLALISFVSFISFASAGDLPASDRNHYQLVLVGFDRPWFTESPKLARVKSLTSFTEFKPNSPMFVERYKGILGDQFPIVAYLRPDGGVIYFADRHNMPSTADALYEEIKAAHQLAKNAVPAMQPANEMMADDAESCPDGNCPQPLDSPERRPFLPNMRPNRQPFDNDSAPGFERLFNGFISQTIGSGMSLIFGVIALGFVLFFFLLLIGAMVLVARFWR
jgi:hypothetical protein